MIKVVNGEFKVENLTISETTVSNTQTSEAYAEINKVWKEARSVVINEKLWEANWILPVSDERITSVFGVIRYINGSKTPTRHYGVDFARSTGTVIKAPASGKVVIARKLISPGNYIIINHGMGLSSYYAHLNELKVKEGTIVKQGEVIGSVGETGFATGPHLHFAVMFHSIYVNPWLFIKK